MSSEGAKQPSPNAEALFLIGFRLAVPALLGAILTYAVSISGAQMDQGKQLAALQGQLGIIASQNTDYAARLTKLEVVTDDTRKTIAVNSARILVLESGRRYK